MKKIYNSVLELIGNTPLVHIKKFEKINNLHANIFVKLESKNPGGSAKDRPALEMIMSAIKEKKMDKNTTIIEPTSGNTGIGLAMCCAYLDIKLIIVMPENMSIERIKLMSMYGAKVILTSASLGMNGAIEKAKSLTSEIPNSIILGQFDNNANPKAHFESTGPEIFDALNKKVDYFVSAIGTGGTITGVGTYLKSQNKDTKVIGVEPSDSPIITKGIKGPHQIQGIGAGFIPSILNQEVVDEVLVSTNEEAFKYSKMLVRTEGLLVGISSGAALKGAIEIAKRPESKGKNIVVLLPDSGERYMSTKLFEEE